MQKISGREPVIDCRDLTLGYEGNAVVSGLSFTVGEGDYLCVVGENGSGKSTLVKAILGLKSPMSGEIVFGEGIKRSDTGYLPQQTEMQRDFPASVSEIVVSGFMNRCGMRPFYSKSEKAAAAAMLERLGIYELRKRCYRELSGGQQQRVLLARALCAARRLLLLDEPVTGLDPKATAEMYELIARLNREDGMTVIMVSHDLEAALRYSSVILHINAGRSFFGTVAEYRESGISRIFGGGDGNG
jgi:zinc transport system ATP-binding protein